MPLPTGCLPPDPHPDSDPHPFALRHRPSRDLLALLLAGDAAYRCGNRPLTAQRFGEYGTGSQR